jgi:hypothetical protein
MLSQVMEILRRHKRELSEKYGVRESRKPIVDSL